MLKGWFLINNPRTLFQDSNLVFFVGLVILYFCYSVSLIMERGCFHVSTLQAKHRTQGTEIEPSAGQITGHLQNKPEVTQKPNDHSKITTIA